MEEPFVTRKWMVNGNIAISFRFKIETKKKKKLSSLSWTCLFGKRKKKSRLYNNTEATKGPVENFLSISNKKNTIEMWTLLCVQLYHNGVRSEV